MTVSGLTFPFALIATGYRLHPCGVLHFLTKLTRLFAISTFSYARTIP
jgi:hypothetical protein